MSNMPDKRKIPSSASRNSPYAKRTRPSYKEADGDGDGEASHTHEHSRVDAMYGQKSAFPGLDDSVGDELFYGPAEDGIEYLRMVRSEANFLPSFFAAEQPQTIATTATATATTEATKPAVIGSSDQKPLSNRSHNLHERLNGPNKGIYTDGVYVGPPVPDSKNTYTYTTKKAAAKQEQEDTFTSPQDIYYNLLRHRFLLLRSTLKCLPPASAIAALDGSHPISLPRGSIPARKEWRRLVLSVDPQMVQLACMDMGSVINVLGITARLMSENVRSGDVAKVRRFGAWVWGLLGKCREVGQLGTEEVGEIRDLGKRAVRILVKMSEDERVRKLSSSQKLAAAASSRETSLDLDQAHYRDQEQERDDENERDNPEEGNNVSESGNGRASEIHHPGHEMPDAEPEQTSVEELDAAKARLRERLKSSEISEKQQTGDILENKGSQEIESALKLGQGFERVSEQDANTVNANKQARAMLDMIITIVGEYYGQRDLLAAREIWDEEAPV